MDSGDPARAASLGIVVTDLNGRPVRDPGVAAWLRGIAPARARGTVGIVLTSDAAVKRLNHQYAGHDAVTDVLSFAARDVSPSAVRIVGSPTALGTRAEQRWLGDIVIATGRSRRQARSSGHSWRTELRVLALHGLLHLLGYDHTRDAGTMARVERRLRQKGGLGEGLTERAARTTAPRRPAAARSGGIRRTPGDRRGRVP